MADYEPEIGEPVQDVSDLIAWIDAITTTCDSSCSGPLFNSDSVTNDHEDNNNINTQQVPVDFLLIGSKALKVHWEEVNFITMKEGLNRLTSRFGKKMIKNHVDHRFEKDSDWDLICLNKKALMELLKHEEIEEICVNYVVKLEDFEVSEDEFCDSMRWNEFSLRLEMKNGVIIEVEYCTHQYHLLKYLNSKEINSVKVPFLNEFSCGLSPVELLEIIKRSHTFFSVFNSSWMKHFLDIEMIHLIQRESEIPNLWKCIENDDLVWLVYYDRLTKRIVKLAQDEQDSYEKYIEMYCLNRVDDEINHVIRDNYSETLFSVFNVEQTYLNPSFLGTSTESIEYMAQSIAGYMLKLSLFRQVDSEEMEKLILKAMQNVLDYNYNTYLFTIIIEVYWKICDRLYEMLYQPEKLKALFDTKLEVQFKLKNYPIDFENDDVKDISDLNGLYICGHYLPIHVIMNIMSFTHSASDIIHLVGLDKSWHQTFENQDLWKYLYFSRYPTPSHYPSVKSAFQAKSWKLQVLVRSKLNRIQLPSPQGFKSIAQLFKAKFIGKTEIFKQFITDFYSNTYILSKKEEDNSSSDESKNLKAKLMIFWPRQAPIQVDLNIYLDFAMYRSGDSKGDGGRSGRNEVTVGLYGGKSNCSTADPLTLRSINAPEDFIGRHYISNLNQQQYASLFATLIVLGFGKSWASGVLRGYSW